MKPSNYRNGSETVSDVDDWIMAYENHVLRGGDSPTCLPPNLSVEQQKQLADARRAIDNLRLAAAKECATAELLAPNSPRHLSDFRILHEVGRGGMGVVYAAEQLSMRRRVAVKILPLAALIDEKAIARFKNEVTAIATLEHPNIVSVYSIGEERGIHYYAMQLIRGQSMAAVVRELRIRAHGDESISGESIDQIVSDMQPCSDAPTQDFQKKTEQNPQDETLAPATLAQGLSDTFKILDPNYFRNIVRLILPVAEALQHAHEFGIVHRDVKPGNLLLDKNGKLFVADFGLARIEAGAGVTMTGDMIGTLRYMSPEQVQAVHAVVDHRTDIYSLGATLYELLTLQPMWSGDNKAEVIRQISFDEPVGSQKINPAIPTDLDTIIRKATRKDSGERYQTAQALADDLHRFLDNKPILAKRTSWTQQVTKFIQRHPTAVGSSALVFLLLAATFAVSTFLVAGAFRNETQARADEQVAFAEAQAKSKLAREVVDDFYLGVAKKWVEGQGDLSEFERGLLRKAQTLYKVFAEEKADDPEVKLGAARARILVANIEQRMGNFTESIEIRQAAEQALVDLAKLDNAPGNAIGLLFETQLKLAYSLMTIGRIAEANDSLEKASKTHPMLLEHYPDDRVAKIRFADLKKAKALLLTETGELLEAEIEYRSVLEILDQLSRTDPDKEESPETPGFSSNHINSIRAGCLNNLAIVLEQVGRMDQAAEIQHRAMVIQEKRLEAAPGDPGERESLWMFRFRYAQSLQYLGRWRESLEMYRLALEQMEQIVLEYPANSGFALWLLASNHGIANALKSVGETDEAEKVYLRLFSSQDAFAQKFPESTAIETEDFSWSWFISEVRLEYGKILQVSNRFKEAVAEFSIAIEILPTSPDAYYFRAHTYHKNKEEAEAAEDYQAATQYAKEELTEEEDPLRIAELNFMLAASLARLGQWEDATVRFETAKQLTSKIADESAPDPNLDQWQTKVELLFESNEN